MKKQICATVILLFLSASCAFAIQTSTITGLGAAKKVYAELIMPDGQGPFPAVLILHTSGGVKKYDIAYAEKLAQEGYACLIPHYFEAYSISYDTRSWATGVYAANILADFSAEIQYLKDQPKIDKKRIGAIGFSMGGYWALILAGMEKVQAGVSYYGALTGDTINSEIRYHLDDIFTKHSSPVLVLHGQEDMTVNVKYAKQLANMLKEKSSIYELHTYPDAGHRFDRGGSLHALAASDSWSRTLTFLKKHLHSAGQAPLQIPVQSRQNMGLKN